MGLGLLRLFFRLLYGPFAWAYDAVAWLVSRGRWTKWGEVALSFLPEGPVLELGHGPGHLLLRMARQGLRPAGLDPSPQMGALACRRLRRAGLSFRLVRAAAQRLPFPDRSFRVVLSTFPTEFILDLATAREVVRVLAPDGVVVIVFSAVPGGGPVACALRCLYRLTGQSEGFPREGFSAWESAGVVLRAEWRAVGSDMVLLLRGERRGA